MLDSFNDYYIDTVSAFKIPIWYFYEKTKLIWCVRQTDIVDADD